MRISILDQVKVFLGNAKQKNNYVFSSKDLKLTIKNYLVQQKMLYSPIRGIYILKKSDQFESEILDKFKFKVLEKLWWVITADAAIAYYLEHLENISNFKIITKNKSFSSKLWKNIDINYVASKVPRIIKKIHIENAILEIEDPISLYINDYKNISQNSDFIRYIMRLDITSDMIENMIKQKFKISGLSKLAILYKQKNFLWKNKIIMNTLRKTGKQIDYRKASTQVNNEKIKLNTVLKEDLNSLI